MVSSQTMQGSPLPPWSPRCRSSTRPRRAQAVGIANPSRRSGRPAGFWERSCPSTAHVPKTLAAQRRPVMQFRGIRLLSGFLPNDQSSAAAGATASFELPGADTAPAGRCRTSFGPPWLAQFVTHHPLQPLDDAVPEHLAVVLHIVPAGGLVGGQDADAGLILAGRSDADRVRVARPVVENVECPRPEPQPQ